MKDNDIRDRYRKKIDELDLQISSLISERMRLSQEIGKNKFEKNEEIYVPDREAEVLRNVEKNSGKYSDRIVEIYKIILKISGEIQEEIFRDKR